MAPRYPDLAAILLIIIQTSVVLGAHEVDRFNERQTDALANFPNRANQQQHQANLRVRQFIAPGTIPLAPQIQETGSYSKGSIVLPANNELQLNQYGSSHYAHPGQASILSSESPASGQLNSKLPNQTSEIREENYGSLMSRNLEVGLRPANGDEQPFQPLPTIDAPGHSFDWSTSPVIGSQSSQTSSGLTRELADREAKDYAGAQPTSLHPLVTTTEQSNHILQLDTTMAAPNHFAHQKEYPTLVANSTNLAPSGELNNQVIYEGPATAPPAGDYYFSSSERRPYSEGKAPNSWWTIGMGQEYERVINLTKDDYLDYCAKSEFLVSNRQRSLCRMHPKVMPVVARGLKMAIDECQSRFASSRWNCSLVLQNSIGDGTQVFGEFMRHSIRERSYLNALTAASLAHAMTKACSQGELPEECNCDKRIRTKGNRGKIEWVACSDDIDYGARFSRDFTDNNANESDPSGMINTHNNEVGRRIFKSATDITCTCQGGENGLCQTKRCWRHLGSFSDIGEELLRKYESATHVQPSNRDPHKLRPVRRGVRKPKRKDLVFIDESPDYCSPDNRLGVLGTQNRRCNSTSLGPDSCSLLCCGRGYQVFVEDIEEDCNCKFVWCCQVKCDKCRRQVTSDVCN